MQPGTARSLRVVLLVVMATVLVVALGRLVGASPRAAIPEILEPPSPVVPTPAPQSDPRWCRRPPAWSAAKSSRIIGCSPVSRMRHRLSGPLRFRPPAPAREWTGIRDASKPGPRCIQDPSGDPEFGKQSDEDCLSLNVWTPAMTGSPRPVMVWIHGGSFTGGSGKIYDAQWLVVARRHHRRHHQLPARNARVPGPSGARAARRRRQLRIAGSAGGTALGQGQHRQLRRRPGKGHRRRRVRRRHVGVRPPRRTGFEGSVPRGDHPERAMWGPGGSADGRTAQHRLCSQSRAAATPRPLPTAFGRCRWTNCENR